MNFSSSQSFDCNHGIFIKSQNLSCYMLSSEMTNFHNSKSSMSRFHILMVSGLATLLQFVFLLQLPWNSQDCFHSTCQCPLGLDSSHMLLLERCCEGHHTILGGSDQENPRKTCKQITSVYTSLYKYDILKLIEFYYAFYSIQ